MRRALAFLLLFAFAPACGAHRPQTVAIVATGAGLEALRIENQRAYVSATDALRERLRASGGTNADYLRESAPLDAHFIRRSQGLQALRAALATAAAIDDAVRAGGRPAAFAPAAREALEALEVALAMFEASGPLGVATTPSAARTALAALQAIAGALPRGGAR